MSEGQQASRENIARSGRCAASELGWKALAPPFGLNQAPGRGGKNIDVRKAAKVEKRAQGRGQT